MALDLKLYALALPSATQSRAATTIRQNIAKQGTLQDDTGESAALSTDPDEQTLEGIYGGQYARKMATELAELGHGANGTPLPLSGQSGSTPLDGYYHIEEVDPSPASPQTEDLWEYTLTIVRKGTRDSYWRAFTTTAQQVENDFGNTQTAEVGVPAAASKARWYDGKSSDTEDPTLVETRTAELGDVEIYDAEASSFDEPTMIYGVAYADEAAVDVRIWDTQGEGSKLDTDDDLQWQKVFSTGHTFEGDAILDTGLLRLTFDESNNALSAEQWDSGPSSWASVALGSSGDAPNWQLWDVDVREIGLARVVARTVWEDTTDGSRFALDCIAKRGYETALWVVPDGEDPPTPSGLQTKLDPVANGQDFDAQESQGVIRRPEID